MSGRTLGGVVSCLFDGVVGGLRKGVDGNAKVDVEGGLSRRDWIVGYDAPAPAAAAADRVGVKLEVGLGGETEMFVVIGSSSDISLT